MADEQTPTPAVDPFLEFAAKYRQWQSDARQGVATGPPPRAYSPEAQQAYAEHARQQAAMAEESRARRAAEEDAAKEKAYQAMAAEFRARREAHDTRKGWHLPTGA